MTAGAERSAGAGPPPSGTGPDGGRRRREAGVRTVLPGEVREEARALLVLGALPGVGDRTQRALRERFGNGREALASPPAAFAAIARPPAAARRNDPVLREGVDAALAWCDREGVAVVPIGAAGYPPPLYDLFDPPPVLFLRGDPSLLARPLVAVVGSRRSTAYGRRVAEDVAGALVRQGVVVASGLALGIDGAAHRGAMAGGGTTLAVLGSGPDVLHPPVHRALFRRIAAEGLLVSEFLPGTRPSRFTFPRRNRVLAAVSRGVVVVEAARRSGALITADHALDLGRTVLAVPGPIYAPSSEGANGLLARGAIPVLSPVSVTAALELELVPEAAPRAPVRLAPDAGRLLGVLGSEPRTVDELGRAAELDARRTLAALMTLEIQGWALQAPGMRFARSTSPPAES